MVKITLLGEQSVVDQADGRLATRSTRSIALIGYLVLRSGSPLTRSTIAGAFWPDSGERQASTNHRREIHQLRRVIQDDTTLEVTPSHLCWHDAGVHHVDLGEFLRERRRALDATEPHDVVGHGTAALAAYTGDLLPALDDAWLDEARALLRVQCAELCDLVCDAAERSHQLGYAADAMRRRIVLDQYDEPAWRKLMELQAALGDRAGALRTYHRLAGLLELELGVAPDPATGRVLESVTGPRPAPESARGQTAESRTGPAAAPLVGRSGELEVLKDAWREACQGRAGVVLVRGAAGVGKSRMVDELKAHVKSAGGVAAETRCFDSSGPLSLMPISDWLRAPAIAAAQTRLPHVWRRETARLVPVDDDPGLRSQAVEVPAGPQAWEQYRFFEGVARALLAVDRPLLLVLDNLQWCDADTLRLTAFLLSLEPMAPVLIATTARTDVETSSEAAAAWLSGARQTHRLTEVRLSPLDAADTAALAASLRSTPLTDQMAGLLHEVTGGLPLFLVEAARAHDADEGKADGGARWSDILHSRIDQTSPAARETAELAAAVGRTFTLPVLTQASDLSADAVVLAVDELWRERILREVGEGYDFSHDLLRDAAYARVSPPRRWLLHSKLAAALEHLHAGRTDAVAAQLADQYRLAGDHHRAAARYAVAARLAEEVFAHSEALSFVDRAIEEVRSLPDEQERDEREMALRVAATGILLARDGWTSGDLRLTTERIIELAKRQRHPEKLASAMSSLFPVLFVSGQMREAYDVTEQVLALTDPGSDRRPEAHYIHGGGSLHTGRCAAAFEHFEISHSLSGREYTNFSVRTHVFSGCWWAHAAWARGMPDRAAGLAAEAVQEARSSDHEPSLAVALTYGALTHQLLGDRASCERWSQEAIDVCERTRFSYYVDMARALQGWCRGTSGEHTIEKAIDALRKVGALARMPYWLALLADVQVDGARAHNLLEEAGALAVEHHELLWLPDIWRRKAALLPTDAATVVLRRAAAMAEEHGNVAVLRRCEADLGARRAPDERTIDERLRS